MTGRCVRTSVPPIPAGTSWTGAASAAGSSGAGLPASAFPAPPGISPLAQELRAASSYTKRCPRSCRLPEIDTRTDPYTGKSK
eukprot:4306737-Lingulodinium_polyedra.AAC.1